MEAAEPREAITSLLSEVVAEGEDGIYRVRHEEPEEVTEFVREMFRMYRHVNRQLRFVDEVAIRIADPELRTALASGGGKFVLAQRIQREMAMQVFDGVDRWIDEHFERTPAGFELREGASEAIQDILSDVAEVRAELAQDDF